MYITITGSKNNKDVYITQSYRKENGKTSSRIFKKLGKYNELLSKFGGDKDALMAWTKSEAEKETVLLNESNAPVSINFSPSSVINKGEERYFNVGYLFLQHICYELRLDNICRKINCRHNYKYDFHSILTDLIYARIISPSSKLSSYSFCQSFLEKPKYTLQNVYRSLSVMAEESYFIQEELYKNSSFVHPRNNKILYYDCTNYFFEIESEDGLKQYGKGKENRPNPIVTMGLFMDADGIPLAFDIFPGNQNEQGLGSNNNRFFNSFGNCSYVITHSLKKLALSPTQFRKIGSNEFIDLRTIDENDEETFNTLFYKEIPMVTGNMDETMIVTYSPKYKAYQRSIRSKQIERAEKIISGSQKKRRGKNQNDPARFIKQINVTDNGEIASKKTYNLDLEKIAEEEMYDGFYAVITNMEDNVDQILRINKQRWEIEETFRVMKSEFEARPVYVQRDDRIKAHFLICYISLLIYRLLEKKINGSYTCEQILSTLRNMNMTLLSQSSGYVPSYIRTDLTDELHRAFGFRTDYEYLSKVAMRNIVKESKEIKEAKK